MTTFLMVLNDGKTFSSVAGCKIVRVDDSIEDNAWSLDDGVIPKDHKVMVEYKAPEDGRDGFDVLNRGGMLIDNE